MILLTDFTAAVIVLLVLAFFAAMWFAGVIFIGAIIGFLGAMANAIFQGNSKNKS